MKKITSRRLFIRNVSMASLGAVYLSSSSKLSAFTLNENSFAGYNPYAEYKTDLRVSELIGKHITVKGKIFCKNKLEPIEGAKIEVWHLSPNSFKYRHQAKLIANKQGEYSFITDFPNKESGKTPRIYFKISKGDTTYTTELLVNDFGSYITGEHWEKNQTLGDLLQPVKKQSNIQFNISI
ncbi:hypothetical protein L1I30_00210 [Gillisia sp. M10.2A]|uniref:Intradiol ring-cleavage dioxygenases domain-containing protein n=1 Tax=Gillisia lutea TaxID=2909668 RepID=A0ABS9EB15_9FLAO|nr:hypothetical protein [Gillisia lutea]MCF4100076.1 hypothetical protein [Gillisia lutea]